MVSRSSLGGPHKLGIAKAIAWACVGFFLAGVKRLGMATGKRRLSFENVFVWRRVSESFYALCKDEDSDGNLILALPLFRLMRSKQSATHGPMDHDATAAFSLVRKAWRRLRDFVVQCGHGCPYILLVHTLPDVLSGHFGRLQLAMHHGSEDRLRAEPARMKKKTTEPRRAA
jgi:hypothetical protein